MTFERIAEDTDASTALHVRWRAHLQGKWNEHAYRCDHGTEDLSKFRVHVELPASLDWHDYTTNDQPRLWGGGPGQSVDIKPRVVLLYPANDETHNRLTVVFNVTFLETP